MSSLAPEIPRRIALRPLAIPNEHGGWGFLGEPILLGLLLAPSASGAFVALAAVAAFLTRHPLKLAAADWLRGKRYPRTDLCERLAVGYGGAAMVALFTAVALGGTKLLVPLAIAAPLALVQFAFDVRNRGRALAPELAGAVAMGAIAVAMGAPLAAWAILAARSVTAILYVRAALKRENVALTVAAHVAAVAVTPAMLLLLARCIEGVARKPRPAKVVGILELVFGVVFVVSCKWL